VGKASEGQAQAIFASWYKRKHGKLRAANDLVRFIMPNERIVDTAAGKQRQAAACAARRFAPIDCAGRRVSAGERCRTGSLFELP
jgi:hypothetical protein